MLDSPLIISQKNFGSVASPTPHTRSTHNSAHLTSARLGFNSTANLVLFFTIRSVARSAYTSEHRAFHSQSQSHRFSMLLSDRENRLDFRAQLCSNLTSELEQAPRLRSRSADRHSKLLNTCSCSTLLMLTYAGINGHTLLCSSLTQTNTLAVHSVLLLLFVPLVLIPLLLSLSTYTASNLCFQLCTPPQPPSAVATGDICAD